MTEIQGIIMIGMQNKYHAVQPHNIICPHPKFDGVGNPLFQTRMCVLFQHTEEAAWQTYHRPIIKINRNYLKNSIIISSSPYFEKHQLASHY